jgi:hypothetical protein
VKTADGLPITPENLKVDTEADRDKLAKMIMEAVLAEQKARGQESGQTPATRPVPVQPGKAVRPSAAQTPSPVAGGAATSAPAEAGKAGCGSSGGTLVDLTPPPPDQPQPKFVVNQMKCEAKPVWRGTPLEFSFEVTNAGEAPLAVRMKGG